MTIFKCKMCGGTLEFNPGDTVAVCDSCGTRQTLPKLDDDRRANLYDRANHFRRNNEYDKAMGIYEQILAEDNTDAEAYWSLVLCRYGIEYVEDPATHKRVPTVNRAQFTSIFDDDNYKSALHYADAAQREVYEAEAKAINEIQKGILAISQKEQPFDVFICYKETDASGRRTPDSVLANDLYHQLTQEGFKVFFARITLEDKLGTAYEPYIFAALNSAKVMVVLGTKPEYFNAVWVKNEWSRYLALVKQSGGKKLLIPAYKDMDPYDLPEEFSHLQAQDMSKLGFMQDLIRGIKKIISADAPKATVKETVVVGGGSAGVAPLLKRAFMFLEDGSWQEADAYCEKVLDIEPENAQAYLGKLMAELQVHTQADLSDCEMPFDSSDNYRKAIRFGDESLQQMLASTVDSINARNEENRRAGIYQNAQNKLTAAQAEDDYTAAALLFESISEYRDAAALGTECRDKAETVRKDTILAAGNAALEKAKSIADYESALQQFASIPGWKNADENAALCQRRMEALCLEIERKKEEHRVAAEAAKKKAKKVAPFAAAAVVIVVVAVLIITKIVMPSICYKKAESQLADGNVTQAVVNFGKAGGHQDAREQSVKLGRYYTGLISAGYRYSMGVTETGTVSTAGLRYYAQCDSWRNIIAISASETCSVGLKADGTVVASGNLSNGKADVSTWSDIVALSAGETYIVGLKADGTVVSVGIDDVRRCDVSGWRDIVAISTGDDHIVGLKSDGTVVAAGNDSSGQCKVSEWENIVAVSAGGAFTIGLKSDGTVVATGANNVGQCDVSDWHNVVAISAGSGYAVGLRGNGTVIATGSNTYDRCNVSDWCNIVAISAGDSHTIGLKADGTVVATGDNRDGQCDISEWIDITLPKDIIRKITGSN